MEATKVCKAKDCHDHFTVHPSDERAGLGSSNSRRRDRADGGGQEATGAVQTGEKNAFACRGESERGEEWADPVCLEVEQRATAGRFMCGVRDTKQ